MGRRVNDREVTEALAARKMRDSERFTEGELEWLRRDSERKGGPVEARTLRHTERDRSRQ